MSTAADGAGRASGEGGSLFGVLEERRRCARGGERAREGGVRRERGEGGNEEIWQRLSGGWVGTSELDMMVEKSVPMAGTGGVRDGGDWEV
jgi:hypothetical protein